MLHEKHIGAVAVRLKKIAEVPGHCPEVGSDNNAIFTGGQSQNIGIIDSLQPGVVSRHEIHRWLTAATAAHDAIVKTGIRQELDHPSASPRQHLLPHARELFFNFGGSWVCQSVLVFLAVTLGDVLLHFFLRVAHFLPTTCTFIFSASNKRRTAVSASVSGTCPCSAEPLPSTGETLRLLT